MADTPRERMLKRLEALKKDRSTWLEHWREISDFIRPGQYRYLVSERNKGTKKNWAVINNTATIASRTLASGMMAGFTSPSKPWFRLTMANPAAAELGPVKAWLHVVEERIRDALARSNIYLCLQDVYQLLGDFGTAVLFIEEDPQHVIRGYVFPIGQYCLANSPRLTVDSIFREFSMTVGQLVDKFGANACSGRVRRAYSEGRVDEWVEVVHVIEPRRQRTPGKMDAGNMAFRSCWYEKSVDATAEGYLLESGFNEFPAMAPRWGITGEDVYGRSPGMDALGDVKSLQLHEKRKAQVLDILVTPPMVGPSSLRNQRASLVPGGITYLDRQSAGQAFEPAIKVDPSAIGAVNESKREIEQRIDKTYFVDLWLSLLNDEGPQMTAEEVRDRHEEKMLQLGPVVERLEVELADPLIWRVFSIMHRMGLLPPPPPEAQGQEMSVSYISIMAQAQKLIASAGIQRLAGFVANLVPFRPDAADKVNTDVMIEEFADALDVKPTVVAPQDQVDKVRAQRAQQQQAQMDSQNALAATQGARNLAGADLSGDSALSRMLPAVAAAGGGSA